MRLYLVNLAILGRDEISLLSIHNFHMWIMICTVTGGPAIGPAKAKKNLPQRKALIASN